MKIAIVIPSFNRPQALQRLLNSLYNARYSEDVDLIFSIDFSGNDDVKIVAEKCMWRFGNKKIICHKNNLGLRQNILFCGDLTSEYDAIILLEDDLVVSPSFFTYAIKAASFYDNNDKIAGISLYSYSVCEIGNFRFYPFLDEYDTYFIQWPSSWGQLWTRKQWISFREWQKLGKNLVTLDIPDEVKYDWSHSWKKYFIGYMVDMDKYFVYPYKSYSNELGKDGVHHLDGNSIYTVNMYDGYDDDFRFRSFDNAHNLYDCYFQFKDRDMTIGGDIIKVAFDLYGTKELDNIHTDYVITSRQVNKNEIILSFSDEMLPYERNILNNISGNMFKLTRLQSVCRKNLSPVTKLNLGIRITAKEMLKYIGIRLVDKVLNNGK